MSDSNPWGELDLRPEESHAVRLGTLELDIKRVDSEVWVRVARSPAGADSHANAWERWPVPPRMRVELRPAVPDRLLVVSPETTYHLPPHAEARVYVRMPLFAQLVLVDDRTETVALDLPSIVLSDTWWGTFTEGELGYWLTTKARTQLTDDLFVPHSCMCPFRLKNESAQALHVERFAVRVAHLTIFADGGRHWTDEVDVRYEDSPEGSEIRFGSRPPAEAPTARLLGSPRVPINRRFHARTFDRLRSLSHLGL
jgi:hypothetical protein